MWRSVVALALRSCCDWINLYQSVEGEEVTRQQVADLADMARALVEPQENAKLAVVERGSATDVKMDQECVFLSVKKPGAVSSDPLYCVLHRKHHRVRDSVAFSNLLIGKGERHGF